jgi:hypothetical protein
MITLPPRFDLTPSGKIVERQDLGTIGYYENVEYNLFTEITKEGLRISYYGENDTWIDLDEYFAKIKL